MKHPMRLKPLVLCVSALVLARWTVAEGRTKIEEIILGPENNPFPPGISLALGGGFGFAAYPMEGYPAGAKMTLPVFSLGLFSSLNGNIFADLSPDIALAIGGNIFFSGSDYLIRTTYDGFYYYGASCDGILYIALAKSSVWDPREKRSYWRKLYLGFGPTIGSTTFSLDGAKTANLSSNASMGGVLSVGALGRGQGKAASNFCLKLSLTRDRTDVETIDGTTISDVAARMVKALWIPALIFEMQFGVF